MPHHYYQNPSSITVIIQVQFFNNEMMYTPFILKLTINKYIYPYKRSN